MAEEIDLAEKIKRLLKAELKRADVSYDELAERLTRAGIKETKATVANKISRGAFSAVFLVAVLKAIGRESISLSEI
ncbi:DUF6471 domain-containing protein [Singulisphaera rosea]